MYLTQRDKPQTLAGRIRHKRMSRLINAFYSFNSHGFAPLAVITADETKRRYFSESLVFSGKRMRAVSGRAGGKVSHAPNGASHNYPPYLFMMSPPAVKRPCVLRKSCDACSKSKVKCNGDVPCLKCQVLGVACVFSPEQKRGRRARESSPSTILLPVASKLQKRAFCIVLSLFKFHRNVRDVDWFANQFAALALLNHGASSAAKLREFMDYHKLYPTLRSHTATISLVNLPKSLIPLRSLPLEGEQTFLGCIQATSAGKVNCSAEIMAWLGVNKNWTNLLLPKDPVLPFGLDVFCAISDNNSQVVALARDLLQQRNSATPQGATISLLDRIVTVKAKSAPVRCYMSVRFTQAPPSAIESEWTIRFFFFIAHGLRQAGLVELPDLELPSFSLLLEDNGKDDDWLDALLEWV
ncbi:hypothetical protein BASA81_012750 [Batrachochytrium salamandrivorans]|nr:hypothetical protein BASA81_012750 [Batrachochytrium salamandrivorans]